MEQARQYPLLTREQEVDLGERVQYGKQCAEALVIFGALGNVLTGQTVEPVPEMTKAINDGEDAKQEFINANLRLVVFIAGKYVRQYEKKGATKADCVQEGNLGLLKAVDRFDPRKGFRFSSYARWLIRAGMQKGLRQVSNQENVLRLNAPIHDGTDSGQQIELVDTIADKTSSRAHDSLINDATHSDVVKFLLDQSGLSVVERDLIETTFLSGHDPQTIVTSLRARGLTREKSRRLESIAFRKIRFRAEELGISESLFG